MIEKSDNNVSNEKKGVDSPPDATPATHIFASDLLVVDNLIAFPTSEESNNLSPNLRDKYAALSVQVNQLLASKGAQPGDKISITADEFKDLSLNAAGLPNKMEPGGSTADILSTVKHLRGDKANIDLLGIAGTNNLSDELIIHDLHKSGIEVAPGATEGARSAVSFIFTHPDGKRTNITYPGNAADKLNADMVTDERIAKSDSVFIPISLWSKFDHSIPEAMLEKAIAMDKPIILSIPKQATFTHSDPGDIYKRLVLHADVIIADESELARWYKTGDNYEQAIGKLQIDMAKRDAVREGNNKPPRQQPVTALIKHSDDSATVLVAASPPGVTPPTEALRYDFPAPESMSEKNHSLGVDDAIYAGFIAGLSNNLPPQNAAEFAMGVAQTKSLYDSVRIPNPVSADKVTRERWKELRTELNNPLLNVESAIGLARTGVSNFINDGVPRTPGQKTFDFVLYPLVANIGVFALSTFVTYHSNFNQNKANTFVARSDWFKKQLSKIPMLSESPEAAKNLNMVIWSFIDGSIMAPVVAAVEAKRQKISHWIDEKRGTVPEDASVYEKEVKRNWQDVIKARATTFGLVIATFFALNAKTFPNSAKEGILSEIGNSTGTFAREPVNSVNGFVFGIPGKKIGGWLSEIPGIRKWAQKMSDNQLSGMAKKTSAAARKATDLDARYQIEGMVNTGLFEVVYTSLCTAGLFFLGKNYASKRKDKQEAADVSSASENVSSSASSGSAALPSDTSSWAEKVRSKTLLEKNASYIDAVEKTRNETLQLST